MHVRTQEGIEGPSFMPLAGHKHIRLQLESKRRGDLLHTAPGLTEDNDLFPRIGCLVGLTGVQKSQIKAMVNFGLRLWGCRLNVMVHERTKGEQRGDGGWEMGGLTRI